jgi:hypothetical protein
MLEVTFHNVTISIQAETADEAYTQLANAVAAIPGGDMHTTTYTLGDSNMHRPTTGLFPLTNYN